jgi:hypothetical protein
MSQTTLGQKQHKGAGLTLEELQHWVNEECEAAGLGPHFKVGPPEEMANMAEPQTQVQKWWICQDFQEVSKHMKVAPMPQGNICVKQHRLGPFLSRRPPPRDTIVSVGRRLVARVK